MSSSTTGFTHRPHPLTELVYGAGSLARLPELLERLRGERALLITSPSMQKQGTVERMSRHLGSRLCGVFDGVRSHSPIEVVEEATREYARLGADMVISLGGGSSVDTAKGIVHLHRESTGRRPPHIAVPTTLSGAEFTRSAGITHGRTKKVYRTDLYCEVVLLDPELALMTPVSLLLPSGLNAIAHCVEGVCSVAGTAVSEAMLLHALRLLGTSLVDVKRDPGSLAARGAAQVGGALAAMGIWGVPMGLEHALAHVVGGRYKAPHALVHAVLIAPVMRFNHPVVFPAQAAIGEALGVPRNGGALEEQARRGIERLGALLVELDVPTGLRALEVREDDIDVLAAAVRMDHNFATNPRPIQTDDEVKGVLRDAL